jgi:hypothetical protein
MKQLAGFVALVLVAWPLAAHAAEKTAPAGGAGDPQQAMMEMMAKAATPGPQHEMLRRMEGEWDQKVTHFIDPAKPQTSHTTATIRSILGGRYTLEESNGQVMGMPFHAMGITGYDNVQKKFVAVWVDNMGTGIILSEGQGDDDGRTIRWTAKMSDPAGGGTTTMRMVTKAVDDDHHLFEMFGTGPDGKEAKMMAIEYTRRKAKP